MNAQPYLRIVLNLDRSSSEATYTQIVAAIEEQINGHGAVAGYRLPPVRVLAHQLSVSKNTVQAAYDELVARGLVENRERVGLFVASLDGPAFARKAERIHAPDPDFLDGEKIRPRQNRQFNLSNVFIDEALLPIDRLAGSFRSMSQSGRLPTQYDLFGYAPLREKIAERLNQRGIEAKADQIVITVGSQMALDLAFRALKRKAVGVESPSYYGSKLRLVEEEFQVAQLPIDPFEGLDLDLWEKRIREISPALLNLVPNFQNPTGYTYSTSEREAILRLASRHGFAILEDDWGSDMMSYSEFSPCFRARGGDSVLYVNSFTKKLLPSLRLGYVVGNEKTVQSLARIKSYNTLGNPTIVEMAMFDFLDRGYYDAHLKSLQEAVDRRYRACLQALSELMPEEVRWTKPGGGPSLWVELPRRVDLDELSRRLGKRDIGIKHSKHFAGGSSAHGFRLGYAAHGEERLKDSLGVLAETLSELMK